MFGWIKRLFAGARTAPAAPAPAPQRPEPAAAPPPAAYPLPGSVGCDAAALWSIDAGGTTRRLPLAHLLALSVETEESADGGIAGGWSVYGLDEDVAFTFPLGAPGEAALVARIAALPGFRPEAWARAQAAEDADRFLIWQRPFD